MAISVLFAGVLENLQYSIVIIPQNPTHVLNYGHENLRTINLPKPLNTFISEINDFFSI
jgi:hypothetical protein